MYVEYFSNEQALQGLNTRMVEAPAGRRHYYSVELTDRVNCAGDEVWRDSCGRLWQAADGPPTLLP
jgi:hypothetical protein